MLTVMPDEQLRVYSGLHDLEATARALEAGLDAGKRSFLHGGPGANDAVGEVLAAARADARLQARIDDLQQQLAARRPAPAAVRSEPCVATPLAPTLRGSTDVIAVADIVAFLSSLQKTGTLSLQAPDALFVLEFQDGAVVHAVTNAPDPELRLGTVLVAQNLVSTQRLDDCVAASRQSNELLGDQLVRTATVSEGDLRSALAAQVQRIFEAAFQLRDAQFTFLDGSVSAIAQRAQLNTTHLLLEAARQTDEKRLAAVAAGIDDALPG